jgi:hypothetical protein
LTAKLQQSLDQDRKDVLNQRRVKELLELEGVNKQLMIKDDEMLGRQSGKTFFQ